MIKLRYFCFFRNNNILYRAVLSSRIDVICNKYDDVLNYISYNAYVIFWTIVHTMRLKPIDAAYDCLLHYLQYDSWFIFIMWKIDN